ncbi:MAG: class I SAM-dependent methyltransferase [Anaerolineae bacterium]|nr:class I SAM-dependent methyltransferase [Anaerolineae bacterium]
MKVNDSGMPEESYWNSLFDIDGIVDWLPLSKVTATVVEIGCGYGTFTVPIAQQFAGKLLAFDIEPSMIETASMNVRNAGLLNVSFRLRDVVEQGVNLESDSVGMVLLFNILHFSGNRILLKEASRILKADGIIAIIHWRKDIPTPRGPAIRVRPDKDQILNAAEGLKLHLYRNSTILPPYHWGIQLIKKTTV